MSKQRTQLAQVGKQWVLARWNHRTRQYSVLDNRGNRCYGATPEQAVRAAYARPNFGRSREEALELAGRIKELDGIPAAKVPVVRVKRGRSR